MMRFPYCRVLIDSQPNSGSWNMAVDEFLLERAVHEGLCTVRLYEWYQPTISLGYFQDAEDASRNVEIAGLPRVRRLTGGGAILHHHALTYSCTLPAAHPLAADPQAIYALVHQQILNVLENYGISARMRGIGSGDNEREKEFLCFSRGDARDVVFRGHKILGSAQRRRRGAVLQHGSLLLSRSEYAPQYPGMLDLHSIEFSRSELKRETADSLGLLICEDPKEFSLSESDCFRIKVLQKQRYDGLNWKSSTRPRLRPSADSVPAL